MVNKVSLEIVNFKKEMFKIEQEIKEQANMSISDKVDFATKTLRRVTPVDTGKARKSWKSKKYKDIFGFKEATISNDVEYIDRLNRGHSKQAPKYFIEQVLTKIGILTPV